MIIFTVFILWNNNFHYYSIEQPKSERKKDPKRFKELGVMTSFMDLLKSFI